MNPYYNSDSLGLDPLIFEESGLCYAYNTLCFWSINGKVYTASDSGCSCPTPFEQYEGDTLEDVLKNLEEVGSLREAEAILENWGKAETGDKKELRDWWGDN